MCNAGAVRIGDGTLRAIFMACKSVLNELGCCMGHWVEEDCCKWWLVTKGTDSRSPGHFEFWHIQDLPRLGMVLF